VTAVPGCAGPDRIIQLHPTLRCNLRCPHCYSESGPTADTDLDVDALCATLTDARALGFTVAAISGGEPTLWRELPVLLEHARGVGLRTALTSNGTLLNAARVNRLAGLIDVLALSLDGPPELHNRMRGHARAFDRLRGGIAVVRDAGIRFGVIHTLTDRSWPHLPWLVDFAADQGAALLQLHPLEMTGRAVRTMPAEAVSQATLNQAYLVGRLLQKEFAGRMNIQLDLALRAELLADPAYVYADAIQSSAPGAGALRTLVVEADGTAVPVSYAMARRYAVAQLRRERLASGWERWAASGWPEFRALCRDVLDAIERRPSDAVVNWHERLVEASLRKPSPASRHAGRAA